MNDSEKIRALRDMTNSRDGEGVLLTYLNIAKRKMLNRLYPFKQDTTGVEIPAKYESLQLEIATVLLNKRGAEGETQHNENGVNRIYGNADIPQALLAEITPMCAIPE